jgi:hypothetical protein
MRMNTIPPFKQLKGILLDEKTCMEFLFDARILLRTRTCACGDTLHYSSLRMGFRCTTRGCLKEFSIFKGTFFYKSHLRCNEIMHLGHLWLAGGTVSFSDSHNRDNSNDLRVHGS